LFGALGGRAQTAMQLPILAEITLLKFFRYRIILTATTQDSILATQLIAN